jgi:hypothetical protein
MVGCSIRSIRCSDATALGHTALKAGSGLLIYSP